MALGRKNDHPVTTQKKTIALSIVDGRQSGFGALGGVQAENRGAMTVVRRASDGVACNFDACPSFPVLLCVSACECSVLTNTATLVASRFPTLQPQRVALNAHARRERRWGLAAVWLLLACCAQVASS